jgi:hypothetical protein
MRPLVAKIKPVKGFSSFLHIGLLLLLPMVLFVLVRLQTFVQLAFILIVLSKWRMFAVRPRFWLANVRANSIDLIVGFSMLAFMVHTESAMWQFLWALMYAGWLIFLKPGSDILKTSLQAGVGFIAGLMALYLAWSAGSLYALVFSSGLLCYLAARHFFDSFDEPYARLLSYLWGYFGAALVWLLGHWLLFYGLVSQPTVILVALGVGLATLYYLDHFDRLSSALRRQILFIMGALLVIVLALSNWGNKIV